MHATLTTPGDNPLSVFRERIEPSPARPFTLRLGELGRIALLETAAMLVTAAVGVGLGLVAPYDGATRHDAVRYE